MDAKFRNLATGVREEKTKVAKVEFELNLKIAELKLKSQPSTPPEVRVQCEVAVKDGVVAVDNLVADCTVLFEHSMEVVTTLQEILTYRG